MTTLQEKIDQSIALIRKGEHLAISLNPEGYFVGFSGGKDSQVLLDLVKRSGVKYRAYYSVTTNDPPDNVYFIRNQYPDVTFLHPKQNFFKLVEKKGLPTIFHRYCCEYLKEGNGAGSVVLTGIRREESAKRASYKTVDVRSRRKEHADRSRVYSIEKIETNQHQCIKGKDKIMIYPLLDWLETDIWEYINKMQLPVNPCYSRGGGRVGCMFCPFSNKKQLAYYEVHYPKFKEQLIAALQKYIDRYRVYEKSECLESHNAQDYYDWWKEKTTLKKYVAEKQQFEIPFET